MAEFKFYAELIKIDDEHMRAYERFKRPVYQQQEQEKKGKWQEISITKQECKE